jgi:peptidoglycan/xylan/chitin deacetylase (PgdA/CDA1 family)
MNGIRYIISFDDGFASELKVTKEILDPLGIKALFFVCPHFIGLEGKEAADFIKGPMRRSDFLEMTSELQPLSWNDLNFLSTTGHVIGSHSMNHSKLSEQKTEEDLIDEIVSPADFLEKKLSRKIDWFAYPFGDITSIDPQSLQIIGRRYQYCCSGLRGINTGETHRLCLTREEINLDQSLNYLKQIITGKLDFYYFFKRRKLSHMANRGNLGSDADSS